MTLDRVNRWLESEAPLENMSNDQQSPMVGNELATAQPPGPAPNRLGPAPQKSPAQKCRYFTSRKGCRAGDACRYLHDASQLEKKRSPQESSLDSEATNGATQDNGTVQGVATEIRNLSINDSRPVARPLPSSSSTVPQRPVSKTESQNPREFQINQLRRRFHPKETADGSGTSLEFGMVPSDPDFPFDMSKLQCILQIPELYPTQGRPELKIVNPGMESAFQENVARGFDDIVDTSRRINAHGTLLGWMNTLDRQLERLLTTTERGPTLTFIPNTGSRDVPETPSSMQVQKPTVKYQPREVSLASNPPLVAKPVPRIFTGDEKAQAEKRRATETKQLEARLSRLPLFQKSRDNVSYTVSIQPAKVERLPVPLRPVKTVKLVVPPLYPLEPSTVKLQGVDSLEARSVEAGFAQWVGENNRLNLMSQINYLMSNMHNFAKTPLETAPVPAPAMTPLKPDTPQESQATVIEPTVKSEDKPHIHVIPRPPEWSVPENESENDTTDVSNSEEDLSNEDEDDGGAPVPSFSELSTAERGVALSFPFLELYGIELIELVGLYITIKCERCKESMDVKNIPQTKENSDAYAPKVETCKKCTNSMSVGFRRQLMHPNSNRAGYLDLDGCTVVDLLPSHFIPTCAECSTAFPAPGIAAVRGESSTAACRQCHRKMVLKIPEVKFLRIASAAVTSRDLVSRRKPKEVLGVVAGQELPRRGRCSHYGKSHRWFRFSCCAKVFPCDKCHDAATDHPNEHANRMLCGYCSREQIYRPENCGICHATLIGKAGSGFWEGGKGTRNPALMSRKDPRKFKRRPGTTPGGASSSKRK